MTPEEYAQRKAFRDLLTGTADGLRHASTQGALAAAADGAATRWEAVDPDFARVLRGIAGQAWSMPLQQVKPVVLAVIAHLDEQVAAADAAMDA